jgi:hypothetical protein
MRVTSFWLIFPGPGMSLAANKVNYREEWLMPCGPRPLPGMNPSLSHELVEAARRIEQSYL